LTEDNKKRQKGRLTSYGVPPRGTGIDNGPEFYPHTFSASSWRKEKPCRFMYPFFVRLLQFYNLGNRRNWPGRRNIWFLPRTVKTLISPLGKLRFLGQISTILSWGWVSGTG